MAPRKEKEAVREVQVSFTRRHRLEDKTWPVCSKKFQGTKKKAYCSRACQNRANYLRHEQEYRERRLKSYRAEKKERPKR